jgi:hypothetical protein
MLTETLLEFQTPIAASNGVVYRARACGGEMPGGTWQGWIEFVPIAAADAADAAPVRTARETTQPNLRGLEYWATGLTPVYLEGALSRALDEPVEAPPPLAPPVFDGPAPRRIRPAAASDARVPDPESVLDPFAAYAKGEAMLRRQLGALSAWHLASIALDYDLTDESRATLEAMPEHDLIELIIGGVRSSARVR